MHFMKPGDVQVNKEINLTLHLMMNDEPLEGATVRYQINKDGTEEYEWVDADEPASGSIVVLTLLIRKEHTRL